MAIIYDLNDYNYFHTISIVKSILPSHFREYVFLLGSSTFLIGDHFQHNNDILPGYHSMYYACINNGCTNRITWTAFQSGVFTYQPAWMNTILTWRKISCTAMHDGKKRMSHTIIISGKCC